MYLELRHKTYFAFHDIPADVQKAIGKKRFSASLKTGNKERAQLRARALEAQWRAEIARARKANPKGAAKDPLEGYIAFWKERYDKAHSPEHREHVLDLLLDELEQEEYDRAYALGIKDPSLPEFQERWKQLPPDPEANRIIGIVTGKLVRLDTHLEEYLATLRNEPKTVDMKRSTIREFSQEFTYVTDVDRKGVQRWANAAAEAGSSVRTLRRKLSELRGYWRYLQSIEAAADDAEPFQKLSLPKTGKKVNGEERAPFEPADVVKLLRASEDRAVNLKGAERRRMFRELADLIQLGMYTGARIEELCGLPVAQVHRDHFSIEDAKTRAGIREVPIHPKLRDTVKRLLKESKDGFLLSDLSPNKYGDRSDAIGKRFGRLKTDLGFGPEHVFHSIRKTVATLLDNAGIPENVAADILGHEKPRITYGLYSGGSTLAVKKRAIAKLRYPGL